MRKRKMLRAALVRAQEAEGRGEDGAQEAGEASRADACDYCDEVCRTGSWWNDSLFLPEHSTPGRQPIMCSVCYDYHGHHIPYSYHGHGIDRRW